MTCLKFPIDESIHKMKSILACDIFKYFALFKFEMFIPHFDLFLKLGRIFSGVII